MLRLFQGGYLVDSEVVLVGRSKVGKCDLVVGTVPSMLLMRAIGLLLFIEPPCLFVNICFIKSIFSLSLL